MNEIILDYAVGEFHVEHHSPEFMYGEDCPQCRAIFEWEQARSEFIEIAYDEAE